MSGVPVTEARTAAGPGAPGPARVPWWTAVRTARPAVVFLLSLASGLAVSSVVIIVSLGPSRAAWGSVLSDPGQAFRVTAGTLGRAYGALLTGSLGSPGAFGRALTHWTAASWSAAFVPLGQTLTVAVPLALGGLGLSIAYRSGVFNIAGPAQMIGGAVLASWAGFSWPGLAMPAHVAAGLLAAAAGGAVLGLVPGVLKVATGANEVIVTIMLNYVMANVLVYLVTDTFFSEQRNSAPIGRLTTPSGTLPLLFGGGVPIDAGVIVAVVMIAGGWLLMTKSRLGFEFELSGMSPGASQTAGVNAKRTFVLAFVISGMVVGLAGGVQVLGSTHQLASGFGGDVGFLAITVAFVGRNRPAGIALAALLYGILQTGGLYMQGTVSVAYQLSTVIEAVVVLFVTAPALVAELCRLRPPPGGGFGALTVSSGWGK